MSKFDAEFHGDEEQFDFDPEYDFDDVWTCTCGYENSDTDCCQICGREYDDVAEEYA